MLEASAKAQSCPKARKKAGIGLFLYGRNRICRWMIKTAMHVFGLGMENEYEKNLQI